MAAPPRAFILPVRSHSSFARNSSPRRPGGFRIHSAIPSMAYTADGNSCTVRAARASFGSQGRPARLSEARLTGMQKLSDRGHIGRRDQLGFTSWKQAQHRKPQVQFRGRWLDDCTCGFDGFRSGAPVLQFLFVLFPPLLVTSSRVTFLGRRLLLRSVWKCRVVELTDPFVVG